MRNAGALVNGPVDLRITLWDSDAAGAQVGPINNYQALPITDGRFAVGLNFGGTAFDGSNRWVQLEFRSPAGSGQYLTLNPRDKIMATPYAMFALNGGNGIWNYNAKAQTVSVLGQKVGIGTANPTAALEVVGTGGDDSVKLPAGSIGLGELASNAIAKGFDFPFSGYGSGGPDAVLTRTFILEQPMSAVFEVCSTVESPPGVYPTLRVDGVIFALRGRNVNGSFHILDAAGVVQLAPGPHTIEWRVPLNTSPGTSWDLDLTGVFVSGMIP